MATSPKQIYLSLDPDLRRQIEEYQRSMGFETVAEAIRVLVRQSISATPMDSQAIENVREGYGAVRRWAFGRLREKLGEIERELVENSG